MSPLSRSLLVVLSLALLALYPAASQVETGQDAGREQEEAAPPPQQQEIPTAEAPPQSEAVPAQTQGISILPFPYYPQKTCPVFYYDSVYDLQGQFGSIQPNPNVQLVEGIYAAKGCNSRGVLKIALASAATDPSRRRVLVDLFFYNPYGWVFNLGDSVSNNGYGGDSNDQSNDAEFFGFNNRFLGYYSDMAGSGIALNINNLYYRRLSLIAADGQIVWLSDNPSVDSYNFKASKGFFALNGQSDAQGSTNYDLYLGMNKVIQKNSWRTGGGLCKVGIKFLPEY